MGLTLADIGVVEFHEAFAGESCYCSLLLCCVLLQWRHSSLWVTGLDTFNVTRSWASLRCVICLLRSMFTKFDLIAPCLTLSSPPSPHSLAGQVLANMVAMGSEKFAAERLPGGKIIGKFDMGNVNTRGGSLALGHPFGATGT